MAQLAREEIDPKDFCNEQLSDDARIKVSDGSANKTFHDCSRSISHFIS